VEDLEAGYFSTIEALGAATSFNFFVRLIRARPAILDRK
jgi:hypothetical protein